MKPPKDLEEAREVGLEVDSEEGEMEAEGSSRCYNCNEQGHLAKDCPHPRRPWFSHCRNNGHATEDCPELIAKWEDRVLQQGYNLISSELKRGIEGQLPKINIITHGGAKTGADADNQPKIQKVVPKDDRYDPVKQKLFLKNAIEIFKSIPTPEIIDNPPEFTSQPNLAQAPTSPRHLEILQSQGDTLSSLKV
jgi:hypothetical protein